MEALVKIISKGSAFEERLEALFEKHLGPLREGAGGQSFRFASEAGDSG